MSQLRSCSAGQLLPSPCRPLPGAVCEPAILRCSQEAVSRPTADVFSSPLSRHAVMHAKVHERRLKKSSVICVMNAQYTTAVNVHMYISPQITTDCMTLQFRCLIWETGYHTRRPKNDVSFSRIAGLCCCSMSSSMSSSLHPALPEGFWTRFRCP